MTPAILQYRALEHWDGKLPEYNAGALPLLTFDLSKLGLGMNEAARQKALEKLLAETNAATAANAASAASAGNTGHAGAKDAPEPPAAPPAPDPAAH
jgi:hypothetical protein